MHTFRSTIVLAVALSIPTLALAGPKFVRTWKAPGAGNTSFVGKKVAALIISNDENLRVSGEEALVRELGKIGLAGGVATYRIVPKEELKSADKARVFMERAGVEGVVALRLVSQKQVETYTPYVWTSYSYSSFWGYYDYGWGSLYQPGYVDTDTIVTVETLVFSVPANALLWAAVTESKNPKNAAKIIEDLVAGTVKEMKKQGLIRRETK